MRKKNPSEFEKELITRMEAMEGEFVSLAIQVSRGLNAPLDQEGLLAELVDVQNKVKAIGTTFPNIPHDLKRKIQEVEGQPKDPFKHPAAAAPPAVSAPLADIAKTATGPLFVRQHPQVSFRPILISPWMISGGAGEVWNKHLSNWFRVGDDIDIVVTAKSVYMMREKGRLREILRIGKSGIFPISSVFYDGKYLWVLLVRAQERVVVLDLETLNGVAWREEDGLGPMPDRAAGIPIEPGKILIASYFERLSLGILTYDGPGSKTVEIIHEARNVYGDPSDVQTAFRPGRMVWLEEKGTEARHRIAIGRSVRTESTGSGRWRGVAGSLVVDLETKTVEVGGNLPSKDLRKKLLSTIPNWSPADPSFFKESAEVGVLLTRVDEIYAIGLQAVWRLKKGERWAEKRKLRARVPTRENVSYQERKVYRSNFYDAVYQLDDALLEVKIPDPINETE